MTEHWRNVFGWPYEASDLGNIRRANGRAVRQWIAGQFYPMVMLYRVADGRRQKRMVAAHRVVAESWLGPAPSPAHQVDHRDGDRFNNRADNLQWVTGSQNIQASVARGHRGENRWNAKLTADHVRAMWTLRHFGFMQREIASLLGVSKGDVSKVHSGRSWRHIPNEYEAA